jgi:hypothetical protein
VSIIDSSVQEACPDQGPAKVTQAKNNLFSEKLQTWITQSNSNEVPWFR